MLFINVLCLFYLMVLATSHTISKSIAKTVSLDDTFDSFDDFELTRTARRHKPERGYFNRHERFWGKTVKGKTTEKATILKTTSPTTEKYAETGTTRKSEGFLWKFQKTNKLANPTTAMPEVLVENWDGTYLSKLSTLGNATFSNLVDYVTSTYRSKTSKEEKKKTQVRGKRKRKKCKKKHKIHTPDNLVTPAKYKRSLQQGKSTPSHHTTKRIDTTRYDNNDITQILAEMSTKLDQLKLLYSKSEYSTTAGATYIPNEQEYEHTTPMYPYSSDNYEDTAVLESLLNDVKYKAIEMIAKHSPFVSDMITNAVTETTYTVDPMLIHLDNFSPMYALSTLVSINEAPINREAGKLLKKDSNDNGNRRYFILQSEPTRKERSATETKPAAVATLPEKIEHKLNNIFHKVKNGAKETKKKVKAYTKYITKKVKNTTTQRVQTKASIQQKEKSITELPCDPQILQRRSHSSRYKHAKHVSSTETGTTLMFEDEDESVLSLVEQMLAKAQESNMIKYLSSSARPLIKRHAKTSVSKDKKVLKTEDILFTPNLAMSNYREVNTEPTIDETSYEGLSKKLSYDEFVNGFKHYLKFEKDMANTNFSNMVRYQAHRHHNVDDIGKYILDKIPQIPGLQQRYKRKFFDYDDEEQDMSTKSEESWFKKHFYYFVEHSETPKKYHTSQTVTLKSPEGRDATTEPTEHFIKNHVAFRKDASVENTDKLDLDELLLLLKRGSSASSSGLATEPTSYASHENVYVNLASPKYTMHAPHLIDKILSGMGRPAKKSTPKDIGIGDNDEEAIREKELLRMRRHGIDSNAPKHHYVQRDSLKPTKYTTPINLFDQSALDETNDKKKLGYVNVNLEPATTTTKRSKRVGKIRKFFRKLKLHKRTKTKERPKRQADRLPRFNIVNKLKHMFNNHNVDDKKFDDRANFEDYDIATKKLKAFKPIQYNNHQSSNELKNQVPRIFDKDGIAEEILPNDDRSTTTLSAPANFHLINKDKAKNGLIFDKSEKASSIQSKVQHAYDSSQDRLQEIEQEIDKIDYKMATSETPMHDNDKKHYINTMNINPQSHSDIFTLRTSAKKFEHPKNNILNGKNMGIAWTKLGIYPLSQINNISDDDQNTQLESPEVEIIDSSKHQKLFIDKDIADLERRKSTHQSTNLPVTILPNMKKLLTHQTADLSSTVLPTMKNDFDYHSDPNSQTRSTHSDDFNDLIIWHSDLLHSDNILKDFGNIVTPETAEPQSETMQSVDMNEKFEEFLMNKNKFSPTPDLILISTQNGDQISKKTENRTPNCVMKNRLVPDTKEHMTRRKAKGRNLVKRDSYARVTSDNVIKRLNDMLTETTLAISNRDDFPVNAETTKRSELFVDTTLLAYDDNMDYFTEDARKLSKNSLPDEMLKTTTTRTKMTPPRQYYTTPLPMRQEDFENFLKINEIDVGTVMLPEETTDLSRVLENKKENVHKAKTKITNDYDKVKEKVKSKESKREEGISNKSNLADSFDRSRIVLDNDELIWAGLENTFHDLKQSLKRKIQIKENKFHNYDQLEIPHDFLRSTEVHGNVEVTPDFFESTHAQNNVEIASPPNSLEFTKGQRNIEDLVVSKTVQKDFKMTSPPLAESTKKQKNVEVTSPQDFHETGKAQKNIEVTLINFDDVDTTQAIPEVDLSYLGTYPAGNNEYAIPTEVTQAAVDRASDFKAMEDHIKHLCNQFKINNVPIKMITSTPSARLQDKTINKPIHRKHNKLLYVSVLPETRTGDIIEPTKPRDPLRFSNIGPKDKEMISTKTTPKDSGQFEPNYPFLVPEGIKTLKQSHVKKPKRIMIKGQSYKYDIVFHDSEPEYDIMKAQMPDDESVSHTNKLLSLQMTPSNAPNNQNSLRGEYFTEPVTESAMSRGNHSHRDKNKIKKHQLVSDKKETTEFVFIEEPPKLLSRLMGLPRTKPKEKQNKVRRAAVNVDYPDGHQNFRVAKNFKVKKKKIAKRDLRQNFTAKNVAAIEVIVDLVKNNEHVEDATTKRYPTGNASFVPTAPYNSNTNSIEVHIAVPRYADNELDNLYGKRSCEKIKKVFTAKLCSPVNIEYQINSFEDVVPTTAPPAHEGVYLLVERQNASLPTGNFILKPIVHNIKLNSVRVRATDFTKEYTSTEKLTTTTNQLSKVTLSRDFITAVNKHLVELYQNLLANETMHKIQARGVKDRKIVKRALNWKKIKKYFHNERVCNCKCRANKTMCRACAASDAVMRELIFEINNLIKYMTDHCTEIQTYFYMNPSGGRKLRDSVRKLDKTLQNYFKRVKGKCQGKTCDAYRFIDKRNFLSYIDVPENDYITNHLTDDIQKVANDIRNISALKICFSDELKQGSYKLLGVLAKCVDMPLVDKDNDVIVNKRKDKLVKKLYSLDNVNVNIICHTETSTAATTTESTTARSTASTAASTGASLDTYTDTNIFFNTDTDTPPIFTTLTTSNQFGSRLFDWDSLERGIEPKKRWFHRNRYGHNKPLSDDRELNKMTFLNKLTKREAAQVDSPLNADTSGSFWNDYINKGHDKSTSPISTNKQETEITTDRIKHKTDKTTDNATVDNENTINALNQNAVTVITSLESNNIGNNTEKSVFNIKADISKIAQTSETTEPQVSESLNYNINELFKLLGNTYVNDFSETTTTTNTTTVKPSIPTNSVTTLKSRDCKKLKKKKNKGKNKSKWNKQKTKTKSKTYKTHPTTGSTVQSKSITVPKKRPSTDVLTSVPSITKTVRTVTEPMSLPTQFLNTLYKVKNATIGLINPNDIDITTKKEGNCQLKRILQVLGSKRSTDSKKDVISNKNYQLETQRTRTETTTFGMTTDDNLTILILNDDYLSDEATEPFTDIDTKVAKTDTDAQKSLLMSILKYETRRLDNEWQKFAGRNDVYQLSDDQDLMVPYDNIFNVKIKIVNQTQPLTKRPITAMTTEMRTTMEATTEASTRTSTPAPTEKSTEVSAEEPEVSIEFSTEASKVSKDAFGNYDILSNFGKAPVAIPKKVKEAGLINRFLSKFAVKIKKNRDVKAEQLQVRGHESPTKFQPSTTDKRGVTADEFDSEGVIDATLILRDRNKKSASAAEQRRVTKITRAQHNSVGETCESPRRLCDLQDTFAHILDSMEHMKKRRFENYVKNVTCHKYMQAPDHFYIAQNKRRTKGISVNNEKAKRKIRWDWIRAKRSLLEFDKIEDTSDFNNDDNELTDFDSNSQEINDFEETEVKNDEVHSLRGDLDSNDGFEKLYRDEYGIYRSVKTVRTKRTIIDVKALSRELRGLPSIKAPKNEIYAMPGDFIIMTCTNEGPYSWRVDRGELLDNVAVDGAVLRINGVRPGNSGNYSCSQGDSQANWTRLSVVEMPAFRVVFLPLYRSSRECTANELRAVRCLGELMAKAACPGASCAVQIDQPVCLRDEADNSSLLSMTASITLVERAARCSMECRRDLHCSLALLAAANAPVLASIAVTVARNSGNVTLTPMTDRRRRMAVTRALKVTDSNPKLAPASLSLGDVDVVLSCPAGYYLVSGLKICVARPAHESGGERRRQVHGYDWWRPTTYLCMCAGAGVAAAASVACAGAGGGARPGGGRGPQAAVLRCASASSPRRLSPSRVILPRLFRHASSKISQETKLDLSKNRRRPPLPPVDFD